MRKPLEIIIAARGKILTTLAGLAHAALRLLQLPVEAIWKTGASIKDLGVGLGDYATFCKSFGCASQSQSQ